MRPGAPGHQRVGVVLPPGVGHQAGGRAVGVLPRVDVERATVGVRGADAGSVDDLAAVERRGVAGRHRPVVVGTVQPTGPAEPVHPVHRPDREALRVHLGEGAGHPGRSARGGDQLAAVAISVVAPVVDAHQTEAGATDRAAAVPRTAGHLPPDAVRDAGDGGVGAVADGPALRRNVDPRLGRGAREPHRLSGRQVVDPVHGAAVAGDPVALAHDRAPPRVDPRPHPEGRLSLSVGVDRGGPFPAAVAEPLVEPNRARHRLTQAGAPPAPGPRSDGRRRPPSARRPRPRCCAGPAAPAGDPTRPEHGCRRL